MKPLYELLKMILNELAFIFEPFLKRWKSGENQQEW